MSWEYSCPECHGNLNPGCSIVMAAKCAKGERVLIGMHPQPGKYEVYLPPRVECADGSKWEFFCPLCGESLVTERDRNLCELDLTLQGETMKILFSRVAGEHATFIMHDDVVEEVHGNEAEHYQWCLQKRNFARF